MFRVSTATIIGRIVGCPVKALFLNLLNKAVMETHLDEKRTKTSRAFGTRMQYQLVDECITSIVRVYITQMHTAFSICRI